MPFLKVPKIFRRSGGKAGNKMEDRSHKNIGELPSRVACSPANKKKAAKKITRTEKKIAKRAAKAEKKAAKKGGMLYGQGSPGSPQGNGKSGGGGRPSTSSYEYQNQPSPAASGSVGGSGASVADRSMNPVVDEVVRRPSFNTSSLSGSQRDKMNTSSREQPSYHQQQQQQQQQYSDGKYRQQQQEQTSNSFRNRGSGPVDLDDENFEATTTDEEYNPEEYMNPLEAMNGTGAGGVGARPAPTLNINTGNSNHSNNMQQQQQSNSLNHHQLQQFEMQQRGHPHSNLYGQQQHHVTRLPNGQLVAYDSPDRMGSNNGATSPASPTYSSDFCLSTDNEDESYNQLRRNARGLPPGPPPGSALSPTLLNSPDNSSTMYTDDEGGTLFANLKGQFSEEEEPISPPSVLSPDSSTGGGGGGGGDLLPPPPSGMKGQPPSVNGGRHHAAGPRDPDGDFSQMDPPSMDDETEENEPGRISIAPMDDLRAWTPSPDKSKTPNGSSRADGSSAGSVENRNPNPHGHGQSPRYTFADEDEAAMYRKQGQNGPGGELRPASPSPGYKVNGGSNCRMPGAGPGAGSGAVMYPDSTDSEFESVPVPNGALLPAMQDGSGSNLLGAPPPPPPPGAPPNAQQQRAHAQDHEQHHQQQRSAGTNIRSQSPVRDIVAKFENKRGSEQQSQPLGQKQVNNTQNDAFGDSFANFANFDSTFDPFTSANGSSNGAQGKQQGQGANGDGFKSSDAFGSTGPTFIVEGGPAGMGAQRSSNSAAADASPLDDLVALQKERELSKSSRRSRKDPSKSSSSINSAPVINSAYLRQTHKLGNAAGDTSSTSGRRKTSSRYSESGARSSASAGSSSAAMAAKDKLRQRRREKEKARSRAAAQEGSDDDASDGDRNESWLFDGVTGTLGPRGIAADLESLGGRSNRSKNSTGNKSHRSHRSHRSSKSRRRKNRSDASVGSRDSRYSHKSYRSSRSQMSHMSEQSRSVANDLLRLEMQLAMVGAQKGGTGDGDRSVGSRRSRTSRGGESSSRRSTVTKRTKVTVVAPPGKLGIILANKTDAKGTVVSGVRTSSVLADKVSPGDRIIAIDGEDVSRMTVSEITTIMARKAEFERVLTVLTSPKTQRSDDLPAQVVGGGELASVGGSSVTSFSQSYRG